MQKLMLGDAGAFEHFRCSSSGPADFLLRSLAGCWRPLGFLAQRKVVKLELGARSEHPGHTI